MNGRRKTKVGDWRMSALEMARTRRARMARLKIPEMCRLCGRVTIHNRWVGAFSKVPLANAGWSFCGRDCAQAFAVQFVMGEEPPTPEGYWLPHVMDAG